MSRKFYGPPRTDFGPPPPGYIPGVGRGARAFSTRSDKGNLPVNESVYVAQRGQGPAEIKREREKMMAQKKDFQGLKNTSELIEDNFADDIYNAIDARMASRRKRKEDISTEPSLTLINSTTKSADHFSHDKQVSYLDQFKELKQKLGEVSTEQWEQLPDALDFSKRNQNSLEGREKYGAVTDSIILSGFSSAVNTGELSASISVGSNNMTDVNRDIDDYSGPDLGLSLELGGDSEISRLKQKVAEQELSKLDRIDRETEAKRRKFDISESKSDSVDDMKPTQINTTISVSDLAQQRLVLKSVLKSNPNHAPAWIAASRLERDSGNIKRALELVEEGCRKCPTSEDLWIEWTALDPNSARNILAKAASIMPRSSRIWIHSAGLEKTLQGRKAVLRRALELLPDSADLWKEAISLETPSDARILLSRAVEMVPNQVSFWIALAKLENYQNARSVLNQARLKLPKEPLVWIAAASLEESNGKPIENVQRVLSAGINALKKHLTASTDAESHPIEIDPPFGIDYWRKQAQTAEIMSLPLTAEAIIRLSLTMHIAKNTHSVASTTQALAIQVDMLSNDALSFEKEGYVECSRVVRSMLSEQAPEDEKSWLERVQFEERCSMAADLATTMTDVSDDSSTEKLYSTIQLALRHCPSSASIVLYAVKQMWSRGRLRTARSIFGHATDYMYSVSKSEKSAIDSLEELYCTFAYLEFFSSEFDRAIKVLETARERLQYPKVWVQSIAILRHIAHSNDDGLSSGNASEIQSICESLAIQSMTKFPTSSTVYTMAAKVLLSQVSTNFVKSVKTETPDSVLPLQASSGVKQTKYSDIDLRKLTQIRDIYKTALNKIPDDPNLWLEYAQFEFRFSTDTTLSNVHAKIRALLETARALNPDNQRFGLVWTMSIALEYSTGNTESAEKLLARALTAIKNDGQLLAYSIKVSSKYQRKSKTVQALQLSPESPYVYLSAAKLCWDEGKTSRCRGAFERAIAVDPLFGDTWAFFYAYEKTNGSIEQQNSVLQRCVEVIPTYGVLWESVAKQRLIQPQALHEVEMKESETDIEFELTIEQILIRCAEKVNPINIFGTHSDMW